MGAVCAPRVYDANNGTKNKNGKHENGNLTWIQPNVQSSYGDLRYTSPLWRSPESSEFRE